MPYTRTAIVLHWLIAVLIIGNVAGGLLSDTLRDVFGDAVGSTIIGLHKSIGLTVIALTLVRIGWRLRHTPPPLPDHMTRAEVRLSQATHLGFYALMLAMPLTGWAMSSTGKVDRPLLWFGLFDVPKLPLPKSLNGLFADGHEWLGWLTLAMVVLHVSAAVKHQIFDRDDLIARMRLRRN